MSTVAAIPRQEQSQPAFQPKRIADILVALGTAIEPDWIVPGYTAAGLLTILAAQPKVGKSTLAASLVRAAKDGGAWLGEPVRKCRVLWIDLEMGESQTARVFQRADAKDGDVWIWSGHRDGFELSQLRLFIQQNGIELVVIDSWSKFALVDDENNNAKVTKEMNTLLRIARDLNVATLLIHHQKKATDGTIGDLRGAGAIGADADIILSLYRVGRSASDQRRRLIGSGRFMDVTPLENKLTLRDGRYVLDKQGVGQALPKSQQEALDKLAQAGRPLSFSAWKAATGQCNSTFKNSRKALVGLYIRETEAGYEPTELGRAATSVIADAPARP